MLILERPWMGATGEPPRINWASSQARGLLAALPLNGVPFDATGRNTNNTVTTTISVDGGRGVALFSGAQDYRINAGGALAAATNITICCWIRPSSFANAYNTVFGRNTALQFCDLHIKSTGKLALYVRDGSSTTRSYDGTGAYTLSANSLYFLALTASTTTLTGYVNAEVDAKVATLSGGLQALSGAGTLTVGNNPPNFATRFINGLAFDVRAYNRELTQAELRGIYLRRHDLYQPSRIYIPTAAAATAPSITALSARLITATSAQPRISYS